MVRRCLWPIVIASFVALFLVWMFSPTVDGPAPRQAAENTLSSEWTTAPEGPAVSVALPQTQIENERDEANPDGTSDPTDRRDNTP